jgi:hypothetical protein
VLVGAAFLWGGATKAVSPHVFRGHVTKLGWVPWKLIDPAVIAAAAIEVALGIALATRAWPHITIPVTIVALVILTGISWWGVKAGRTTDCGCYGGYVVPSLAQSVGLNAFFVLLLLVTPLVSPYDSADEWKALAAVIMGIAAGSLAYASLRVLNKTGSFLIDMSPLKIGRAWHDRWGVAIPPSGEHLVSYLGPDCPHCKTWVRVLNAVSQSNGLPVVHGVTAASPEKLSQFVGESGIRFPVATISQTLMGRLVYGVPTTVLVADGRIQNQWSGQMPPEFFARFRDAFFPGDNSARSLEPISAGL